MEAIHSPVLHLSNTVQSNHVSLVLFATVVLLAVHPHEQPRAGHLSAALPVVGLLWSGCGLWPAGSLLWHAHPFFYGSRGENMDTLTSLGSESSLTHLIMSYFTLI